MTQYYGQQVISMSWQRNANVTTINSKDATVTSAYEGSKSQTPFVRKTQATSNASCCKCNQSVHCRNCCCVKNNRTCQSCLPQRLGHCNNITLPIHRSSQETSTASIIDETVAIPPVDVLAQSSNEDQVSHLNIDATWPLPALQPPNFRWGSCSGEVFCTRINLAYEKVVHCRRNLF